MTRENDSQIKKELAVVFNKKSIAKIVPQIENSVGHIISAERVSGGYVHYVFKIVGKDQTAFLKARSDHFARLPHIITDPEKIKDEYKALQLFLGLCAEYFPQVIHYNSEMHYLLLTELLPGTATLETRFLNEKVSLPEIQTLGTALGIIHSRTKNIQEPIRDDGDQAFKANLFKYVLEYPNNSILISAATEHRNRDTQLLIGDSSPKNVFLNHDRVGLCDLEGSYQGSVVYDQAFMIAHILLHQNSKREAQEALEYFNSGYSSAGGILDFKDKLLAQTIQGVFIYRLDNPIIPYNLNRTDEDRRDTSKRVLNTLNTGNIDMEEIINSLIPE